MKTVSAVVLVVLLSTSASAFVVPAAKSPIECECAFDILYVLSRSGCRGVGGMEGDCYNIRIAHHRDANLDPLPFFLFGRHHLGPLQYYPYSHNISTPSFSVVAHTLAPPFPLYVRMKYETVNDDDAQLVSSTLPRRHPREGGSTRRSIWIRPRSRRWTSSRRATRGCTAAAGDRVRSRCATPLTWLTIRKRGTTSVR